MKTLSQYLTANKIQQSDFADLIGSTQATVSRMTTGAMTPSPQLALRVEKATDGEVPFMSWYDVEVQQ